MENRKAGLYPEPDMSFSSFSSALRFRFSPDSLMHVAKDSFTGVFEATSDTMFISVRKASFLTAFTPCWSSVRKVQNKSERKLPIPSCPR